MDVVINYCDYSNKIWQNEYNTARREQNLQTKNNFGYFYKNSLKFILRSIEKNLLFYSNIYLIVPDEEHIPNYIDADKIKVIRHKDIIPKEFLPTFNNNTVDMFIGRISGLSDTFIYINEPLYFIHKIDKIFLKKDYICFEKKEKNDDVDDRKIIFNEHNIIAKYNKNIKKENIFFKNNSLKTLNKNAMWLLNTDACYDIYNSCTQFIDPNKNFDYRLWGYFSYYNNKYEIKSFGSKTLKDLDELQNIKANILILSKKITKTGYETIDGYFKELFPKKSSFEVAVKKETIAEVEDKSEKHEIKEKIDFVFPYVNPNDPNWIKKYEYSSGESYNEKDSRFRDFSVLKYLFRSIEKNAPWINNVYIIIDSDSQLPGFLNRSCGNLRIVRHDDIIPKKFLPTFNSNTIEMFLPFISGLSNKFIYGNDDLLFMNKAEASDFFTKDGKIIYNYLYRYKKAPTGFLDTCYRTWKIIEQNFGKGSLQSKLRSDEKDNWKFIKQYHGCASPRLLNDCVECYNLYQEDIEKSLSRFRRMEKNLNQYIYGYYSVAKEHYVRGNELKTGAYFSKQKNMVEVLENIKNCQSLMACINDTPSMTRNDINSIYKILDIKFPNKSKFEI